MCQKCKHNLTKNKINKRNHNLIEERRRLSDWSSLIALLGIILMIIEAELAIAKIIDKVNINSFI